MNITRMLAGVAVVTAVVALPVPAFAGYFPADRTTYLCNGTVCPGADHVVFNSFTNNPVVGDERPFFAGSLNAANVADRIQVKHGDEIVLRVFVHNNADEGKVADKTKDYVAVNTKVRVIVPKVSRADQNLVAFITADNANPAMVNDTMSLYGDREFTLKYVEGSAEFTSKPDGVTQTTAKVADTIVSDGAVLGDIKGCFQYSGFVTLKVKVNMPTPVTPTAPVAPAAPEAPKPVTVAPVAQPEALPSVGAGSVAALFATVTAAAAAGYRAVIGRRLSR